MLCEFLFWAGIDNAAARRKSMVRQISFLVIHNRTSHQKDVNQRVVSHRRVRTVNESARREQVEDCAALGNNCVKCRGVFPGLALTGLNARLILRR